MKRNFCILASKKIIFKISIKFLFLALFMTLPVYMVFNFYRFNVAPFQWLISDFQKELLSRDVINYDNVFVGNSTILSLSLIHI